jgi:hypothetical protein
MKVVLVLILGLFAVGATADIFDNLRSLKVIQEGKHERLIEALRNSSAVLTQEMFINAMLEVKEKYLNPSNPQIEITPDDIQCGLQIVEVVTAILDLQPWPLLMIDTYAKIQSGFFAGNIRNPGHFTQCINLNIPNNTTGPIRGKHCTLGIRGYIESDFEFPGGVIPPDPIFDM